MSDSTADLLRSLPRIGRLKYDEHGQASVRYTAIDPATKLFTCTCGRPDCSITTLQPLRQHISGLVRAICSAGHCGQLPNCTSVHEAWPGVVYPLQMAASIEDVFADPSYTDDSEAWARCRPAWESDEDDREQASKYVAALTIFNFVWMAYEDAIRQSGLTKFARDKLPVQARKHFAEHDGCVDEMPSLLHLFRIARHFCAKAGALSGKVSEINQKYHLSGAAAGAELARIFRNYIVHGSDPVPLHNYSGEEAFARFYSVSRLLLLLIQSLIRLQLTDPANLMALSLNFSKDVEPADMIFKNIHLKPELWRSRRPQDRA